MLSILKKPVKVLGLSAVFEKQLLFGQPSRNLRFSSLVCDKSGLCGQFKVRMYQHGILSHVLWPLLVYVVPRRTVGLMEKKISSYLSWWLVLLCSFSSWRRDILQHSPMVSPFGGMIGIR